MRWYALCFVPAILALSSSSQQTNPTEPQNPVATFTSTTRVVVLDVVVTDKSGKPVRDLTRDAFTVLEDGKEQEIASFEPPSQHAPAQVESGNSGKPNSSGPPQQQSLTASALTIIVLDELDTQILDQAYARNRIQKFLREHSPRLPEPTALMALEQKHLELLHDYTDDAGVLENALQNHRAELPFRLMNGEGVVGASERLAEALEALREIGAANSHFAGRKNVIWIGAGFPSLNYVSAQPSEKAKLLGYVRETSDLMWQGRIAVYTVNPTGLEVVHENIGSNISGGFVSPPDSATGDLVFEQLAPQTGGRIFRGLNDLDAQIATSVDDGDSYYALSYYPSNRNWDGRFRKIHVSLRNSELTARTRNGYYGVLDFSANLRQLDRLLSRAVINPLSYHSLDVQAKGKISSSKTLTATAQLTVDIDAHGLNWQNTPDDKHRAEITVVAAGFSAKGVVLAHNVKELEVVVDEKKYSQLLKSGMVMNLELPVPPTVVRMRVVARDSTNGNIGTADLTPEGEQFH